MSLLLYSFYSVLYLAFMSLHSHSDIDMSSLARKAAEKKNVSLKEPRGGSRPFWIVARWGWWLFNNKIYRIIITHRMRWKHLICLITVQPNPEEDTLRRRIKWVDLYLTKDHTTHLKLLCLFWKREFWVDSLFHHSFSTGKGKTNKQTKHCGHKESKEALQKKTLNWAANPQHMFCIHHSWLYGYIDKSCSAICF